MRGSAGAEPTKHEGRASPSAAASPGEHRRRRSSAGALRSQATSAIPSVATHRGKGASHRPGG
eukprot:12506650-Alexandrium_andersonii.AAC.1